MVSFADLYNTRGKAAQRFFPMSNFESGEWFRSVSLPEQIVHSPNDRDGKDGHQEGGGDKAGDSDHGKPADEGNPGPLLLAVNAVAEADGAPDEVRKKKTGAQVEHVFQGFIVSRSVNRGDGGKMIRLLSFAGIFSGFLRPRYF